MQDPQLAPWTVPLDRFSFCIFDFPTTRKTQLAELRRWSGWQFANTPAIGRTEGDERDSAKPISWHVRSNIQDSRTRNADHGAGEGYFTAKKLSRMRGSAEQGFPT